MSVVWCTVELSTKKGVKEYSVSSKFLEDENGATCKRVRSIFYE